MKTAKENETAFTGGRSQTRSDLEHLTAAFHALREASVALREAWTDNRLTAARTCQTATEICADSKRLRGELFRAQLPREPTSGALARGLLEEHLGAHSAEHLADAKTVVSELVNNAVVHGHGDIELRVSRRRGRVRIEVSDEGTDARVRSGSSHTPHGLDIVDALSLTWGTCEGSTHVWAELADWSKPR